LLQKKSSNTLSLLSKKIKDKEINTITFKCSKTLQASFIGIFQDQIDLSRLGMTQSVPREQVSTAADNEKAKPEIQYIVQTCGFSLHSVVL
jgi:hypothetical protein